MIAEVLSTGDEVLLGDITDTNSSFLCRRLKEAGIAVGGITAVGDDVNVISHAIETIAARADICLVTGGLGPTRDDLTAEACAEASGAPLERNDVALASMTAYFEKRGWGKNLSRVNEKQAWLPKGAGVLENHNGTAPGFDITIGNCRFFFMPGVPSEMRLMFTGQVKPRLLELTGETGEITVERLMVFGLPESVVGEKLEGFYTRFPEFSLGFRARFPMIEVKLVARQEDGPDINAAKDWVSEQLGRKVISSRGLTLAQETGRLLTEAGQTLSVAESCTGGLIASLITDVAGASEYFLFSATTYANSAKMNILKVSRKTLEDNGAVHELTAQEMAEGARKAGGSDWAVSTTGIAGPTGGTGEKPVGTVCIGVAGPDGASARRFVLDTGDRGRNKLLFAATALEMLRRQLVK
ncbi:MAG: CinA family nicotinamide mononucleotide deamidase-related protein [Desulfobacterales bacterium]|nr:CinA family nicotinamide mononucleotide deamidase-related protein [Desulfobacterales bacterium]